VEEEIKRAFRDTDITLVKSSGGVFDVELDGKLIFSKLKKIGTFIERFPDPGEITKLINKELEK